MSLRFVKAPAPVAFILNRMGLAGIVMPWKHCYYVDNWNKCPEFVRHELVHARQIDRDGPVTFSIRYLYWLAKYGYRNNPYEVEAYGMEDTTS